MKDGRRTLYLAPLLVYVLVASWCVWGGLGQDAVVGQGVDLSGTLWFYEWISNCIAKQWNPSWTSWFFHPHGKNIFADTGNNFIDALLAQPLRLVLGYPRYYSPFVGLILVGNALAVHVLLRGRGFSVAASTAASLVFELHPFVLHELGEGRPTQALLWFLPLGIHQILMLRDRGGMVHALLGGLFFALQAWTYWFTAHISLLVIAPLVIFNAPGRRRARYLGLLCLVLLSAMVFVLPAVGAMLWQVLSEKGASTILGGGDASGLSPATWWILAPGEGIPRIPLLLLLSWLLALLFSSHRLLWISGLVPGLLLLAGPDIQVASQAFRNPLWWSAERFLPFFNRFEYPYRSWAVLAVLLSLPMAEALEHFSGWLSRMSRFPLMLALGLSLALPWGVLRRPLPVSVLNHPAYVDQVEENPGVVLDLPFLCCEGLIHYQPLFRQPLIGGMGESNPALRPPGTRRRIETDPFLKILVAAARGEAPGTTVLPPWKGWVRWVVLHNEVFRDAPARSGCWIPGSGESPELRARASLTGLLGEPQVDDRWATAWDLHHSLGGLGEHSPVGD